MSLLVQLPELPTLHPRKSLHNQLNRGTVCSPGFLRLEDKLFKFTCFCFLQILPRRADEDGQHKTHLAAFKAGTHSPNTATRGRSSTRCCLSQVPYCTRIPTQTGSRAARLYFFFSQHSLGPAELLMSGSLPCKLQNENTAKHKGHCLRSVHPVLT